MKTVYYYDEEGNFSNRRVNDTDVVIYISNFKPETISITEVSMSRMLTLPITHYITRYGEDIYIATRNEFEAKCLVRNHLDLDIHIETSYQAHVYNEHSNSIHDDLLNRLVHKTKSKFRFSLQAREWNGRVEVIASI